MKPKKIVVSILFFMIIGMSLPASANAEYIDISESCTLQLLDKEEAFSEYEEKYIEDLNIMFTRNRDKDEQCIETVKEILEELNEINSKIIENVRVKVYPLMSLPVGESYAKGTASRYYNINRIKLSHNGCNKSTIYHEIGHTIANRTIVSKGEEWSTSEDAKKYIELKEYTFNSEEELSYEKQKELPWEDKISEWFAEDCKQTLQLMTGAYTNGTNTNGDDLTTEVREFILELIESL